MISGLLLVQIILRVLMYGNKNNKVKSKSMKKFTLFIALILTAVFGVKTTASAQTYETEEQIEWIKYAVDLNTAMGERNGIYLCHWDGDKTYKFVTAGGTYGTQAIATTRGIKMTIDGDRSNGYTFTCTLNNPNYGSCLGAEPFNGTTSRNVYLDRGVGDGDNYFYWNITEFPYDQGKSAPYYHLINKNSNVRNGRYVTVSNNNTLQLTTETNDRWLFIPRDAFRNVLLAVTHQTNIEVSGLFQNTRFVRYMDKTASWEWWTINPNTQTALKKIDEDGIISGNGTGLGLSEYGAYRSMAPGAENVKSSSLDYAKTYGNFSSAEIKEPLIMRQTATRVKVGTYTITAQAFVSKGATGSSTSAAYLFASGATSQNAAAQIPELSTEEQTKFFNDFYSRHQNMLNGNNAKYFRGNVAAGEYLATNKGTIPTDDAIYEPNTELHSISISVTVAPKKDYGTDADGTQYGDLIIGIAKYSDVGTVYARNIRVYYSGTNEFGIDSYSTNNAPFTVAFTTDGGIDNEKSNIGGIDGYQYGYARQFNLVRDFGDTSENKVTNPKWEALVLPVNLTVSQVKNAFGDKVQLSELVGLANNGNQIRFKTVNLNNTNEIAIKAGGCYVIKVTKAPEVGRNDEYTFDIYNSTFGDYKVPMTYYGPIYQIDGVTREDALTELIDKNQTGSYKDGVVTKTYKTDDGDLEFTGYFYWNQTAPKDAYVVSRGKMFYLDDKNTWAKLTGTMWKLEGSSFTGAKELSVDFGDGDITNGISGITVEGENNVNATGIYNLNGQKVSDGTSTETLSKGIYIVNGKKYVVR